jgi:nucleoside-diphosphate-sugar epimerase
MKVLLAGASGAIGAPLTRMLIEAGHQVTGLARSEASGRRLAELGATALLADVMDRENLLRAVRGQRADAVINQLTALKKPPVRHKDMAATNALRITGTANLLAAAQEMGVRRFVTQSMAFGYGFRDHGDEVLTEESPFAVPVGNRFDEHTSAMAANERQAFEAPGIDGIALRYGGFYGPGGIEEMVKMLRRRAFPVPAGGGGRVPFVYLDDAASAAVAALEKGRPGEAYNIVDDDPARIGEVLDAMAAAYHAPRPMRVPGGLLRIMPYAHAFLTLAMRISNAKAKRELGWVPAHPSYRDGIAALVGGRQ